MPQAQFRIAFASFYHNSIMPMCLGALVLFYFFPLLAPAQIQTGTWRTHADYTEIRAWTSVGESIYCHTPNGFFVYNSSTKQSKIIGKQDGLSESKITAIASNQSNLALIGYASGQIDWLELDTKGTLKKVIPFAIIRESDAIQESKRINHAFFDKSQIWLACDFGVVLLDTDKRQIRETYRYIAPNAQTIQAQEIALEQDSLFVRTPKGILGTSLVGAKNLQDFRNWRWSETKVFKKNPAKPLPGAVIIPNGVFGEVFSLSTENQKIIATGNESSIFDEKKWQKTNKKAAETGITTQNGWTWEIASGNLLISNQKNSQRRLLGRSANEGNLQGEVLSIAETRNRSVWIGTDNGVAVLSINDNIFTGAVNVSTPFYERRRLLIQERVQAIAIDGGNRKWIGTPKGLYVFNDDGSQLVQLFTAENSPMSNANILDLEILNTGEVFILTADGLLSYQADTAEPAPALEEMLIYPNPVRPDFEGLLTISQLPDDTEVKITDLAGNLIYQTRSNGGVATWSLQYQGQKASSGIYLVFGYDTAGNQSLVAKFAIL